MNHNAAIVLAVLVLLLFPSGLSGQQSQQRETEIHTNVKLVEMAVPADMNKELGDAYHNFLPLFEQVVKEQTADQSAECALTIRVSTGTKEVGSAKSLRAFAQVTAFRKGARREFVGNLFLHSFITNGPVDNQEITKFVKWILGLATCSTEPAATVNP